MDKKELKNGVATKVDDDSGMITKYTSCKTPKEVDERTLRFIFSTEDIDRDKELIKTSGWRLDNFIKAPVILAHHNYWGEPVARAETIGVNDEKQLFGDVNFPEKEISPYGDFLYKMYKGGYMFATSVGFIPNYEKMDFGDTSNGEPRITYHEQELLEVSLVSVPANPNALVESKGFKKAIADKAINEEEVNLFKSILEAASKEKNPDVIEDEAKTKALDFLDKMKNVDEPEKKEVIGMTESDIKWIELIDEKMKEILSKFIESNYTKDKSEQNNETHSKCVKCGHELICPVCDSVDTSNDLLGKYLNEFGKSKDTETKVEGRYDSLLNLVKPNSNKEV